MQDRRCRFGPAARIEMVRAAGRARELSRDRGGLACSSTTVKAQRDLRQQASEAERVDLNSWRRGGMVADQTCRSSSAETKAG
jgi:hypothetical protein